MNKKLTIHNWYSAFIIIAFFPHFNLKAQENKKLWTEDDRRYTIENMRRTRDDLTKAVENLTPAQWTFKESSERWSIAEIVEHLALWEIIWAREIGMGIRNKPMPELNAKASPDSYYTTYIMEEKQHSAPDFARPTGNMNGKDALNFFLRSRNQAIAFLDTTQVDMRAQFELTATPYPRNMHHVYIYQWGHVDRHLRQINKVKQHKDYLKANENAMVADQKAIMAVIQQETDCFYSGNYECWKNTYVQENYTHQGWSNRDGTFDIKVGWNQVNKGIEQYMKNNPATLNKKRRVERKNIQYKFYNENLCYLTWEQYQLYVDDKNFSQSHEIRLMEKRNGMWKIAHQSAFWDYKNLIPIEKFEK